jgi:hypothetical protein
LATFTFAVVADLLVFSLEGALVSFEPHCSQKLFEAGFLALQLAHVFVSAIPNSLVGLRRKNHIK